MTDDPVILALMKRATAQGESDDNQPPDEDDDGRGDPVTAAAGDLIDSVRKGDAEGVAQAVQVMVEAILGRNDSNGR